MDPEDPDPSAAAADFNSSDLEFETPQTERRTRGQESIDRMIERASEFRISSKRTVKQLQYGSGVPSVREQEDRWIARFESFRRDVLGQVLTTPFTSADLIRFLDIIIDIVKPPSPSSTGSHRIPPTEKYVKRGVKTLIGYGTFTWKDKDFKMTPNDGLLLETFIQKCVTEGRLLKGYVKDRAWISFVTLSRMTRAFVEHNLTYIPRGWDTVVSKLFGITLIAALGCRGGDVALSSGYRTQFMRWSDIELVVEGPTANPDLDNLKATITIRYAKGKKNSMNDDLVRYLSPLRAQDIHVCPLAWLLVHALRHGLVHGQTLNQVLDRALTKPDHRIEWVHPTYPVLPAFTANGSVKLRSPASIAQLNSTVKEMGLVSNILGRVHLHALRLGAARDVAHLPRSVTDGSGVTTDREKQYLDHNNRGTRPTARYVGDPTYEMYNRRADNQGKKHRREQKFSSGSALEAVNAPITEDEIVSQNGGIPTLGTSERTLAIRAIKRRRLEIFKDTADPEDQYSLTPPQPNNLIALTEKSASDINANHRPQPQGHLSNRSTDASVPNINMAIPSPDPSYPNDPTITEADVTLLQSTIFNVSSENSDLTEEALGLDEEIDLIRLGSERDTPLNTVRTFIDTYTRINRELLHCAVTPGCEFTCTSLWSFREHEIDCRSNAAARASSAATAQLYSRSIFRDGRSHG